MIPRPPRVPRTDTLCPYPTRFRSVRNAPEKVFVLDFPEFMPPTMVTRSLDAVKDFQARHGAVVIKPLHGNGGKAVFRVDADGANLGALVELFGRSEEHTSELQSLMRNSYAVFCLKKKKKKDE